MTMNSLMFLTLTILSAPAIQGFSFQLPIKLPWETSTAAILPKSPIVPNDKVVIFGGTGGVGQLVTKKLLLKDQYKVCVVARNEQKAKELLLSEC
jgi:NADPH:quinone reductase-like Zn-dependent oxidoreductase